MKELVELKNVRWDYDVTIRGFVALPNLLLDHHEELGIDEKELLFLIKLSRHKETFKVHDDVVIKGCQKNAYRRRKSLKEKKLLNFAETKEHFFLPNGKPSARTIGFTYDLSMLVAKLKELQNSLDEENNNQVEETTMFSDTTVPVEGTKLSEAETELNAIEDKNGLQTERQSLPNNTNYNTRKKTKKNSSNKETTILMKSINKNASIKYFLHKFKHYYPDVYVRNVDLQNLLDIQVSNFTIQNLELWGYYMDHTSDKYLATSKSLDMLLLLKNQTRFKKELKDMAWAVPELKKTLDALNVKIDQLNDQLDKIGYIARIDNIGKFWSEVNIYNGNDKVEYDESTLRRMISSDNYLEVKELVA